MALASREDVQAHLPTDKLPINPGDQEISKAHVDTERVIKGELSGYYLPSTLALWADPNTTPAYIRAIAGRLTAAFYYRLRFAEDQRGDPEYAQLKYDEAMAMIGRVQTGAVVLAEVEEVEPTVTNLRFYPDDDAPGPYFTMDKTFT